MKRRRVTSDEFKVKMAAGFLAVANQMQREREGDMQEQEIIKRLRDGWELSSRGMGWYLSSPGVPYTKRESYPIPDEVVRRMEQAGSIKTSMPYNSIHAALVEAQD
ncbi:hypothetical protein D3C85_1324790 [compost metagenome]